MLEEKTSRVYSATEEIARILDTPPLRRAVSENPVDGSYCHWPHGPLHDVIRPMQEHVLITNVGQMQRVERRTGRSFAAGTMRIGTITTIPAGSSSRWDLAGAVDVIHLYFSGHLLEKITSQIDQKEPGDLLERTAYPDLNAARLLSMVAGTLDAAADIDSLLRQQLTFVLATYLLKAHSGHSLKPLKATGVLSPRALRRALERLDSSCDNDVSLEALANDVGLSPFHFCRAFKKSTGLPPHAWLRQRRLERATIMLRKSDVAISAIAEELGYGSQTAFTAAFKRMTGATPTQWRREQE